MQIFRKLNKLPNTARKAAIAIGNFDGVHPGHQAVINKAGLIAKNEGVPWAVLTFEPHPQQLFTKNPNPFRLTPFKAKARNIKRMGVDILIVQKFDVAFSQTKAEEFILKALIQGLDAHHIVSGYDFVFGHNRGGNCDLLLAMSKKEKFGFTAVSALADNAGKVFSSTRIRERLKNSDPIGASKILGRDFELSGRVVKGNQLGRKIAYPTANIHLGSYLRPANGVYAVRVLIEGNTTEQWLDGVANIGSRPTIGDGKIIFEVFLIDFKADLYGKYLRVRLIDFLREEKKFDGIDQLKAQIAIDAENAQKLLERSQQQEI